MYLRNFISCLLVIFLLSPAITIAGGLAHEQIKIDAENAKSVMTKVEFGAGEIILNTEDMDDILRGEISYNPKAVDIIYEYKINNGVGKLYLKSDHKDGIDIDSEENRWDMTLSTKYPMSLEMGVGACDAKIDLGGLKLENLIFKVGAASSVIKFSKPNPIVLDEISIEAGASSLEMIDIGNANFKYLNFEGGVGSFELDLRGEYSGYSRVNIEVGVGSMDLTLPKDIPVRVETDGAGWLSSVDFHKTNLKNYDDDVYQSDDYEDADIKLLVKIEVGLGSVDIYRK